MEDVYKILNNCESKTDAKRKLSLLLNGAGTKKLLEIAESVGFDLNLYVERKTKYCMNCGFKLKRGQNKFCSSNCSATYNNKKRVLSDKTKRKIGDSIISYNKNNQKQQKLMCCVMCNNEFYPKRNNNGRLSKSTTCSKLCEHNLRSKIISGNIKKRIAAGEHKGWITRNITSYPEKFFIDVLNNNKIEFKHNHPIKQSDLGINSSYNYFLDFYIENKNIDLEIDGQQHERREDYDNNRDKKLNEYGINVYRIKWKNINTKNGRIYIEKEINKFLEYYIKV